MTTDNTQAALDEIHKKYGETSIMRLGDKPEMNIEVIPTGNIAVDLALGVGGFPKGRIVEIYGPESSGKSTLTLHTIAEAQKGGGNVAFIDAEHALDPAYAKALGVDVDNLYISQPDYGEQALDIVDKLVSSGGFNLIVVDSVAALTPQAEIKGEMGDAFVGLHARMMSQAMRKITANINNTKTTVIFTNQIREKIGVMFGSPEVTPGGRALKFYSSIRIDIRRIGTKKTSGEATGNEVRIKVVKNKVAPPFREAEVELVYGKGFVNEFSLVDLGVQAGKIIKSGAWYASVDGEKMGQGRAGAAEWVQEHPIFAAELRSAIMEWAATR
jgi:recombination protein RecA